MRISIHKKSRTKALLLAALLMAGGCASTYRATPEDTRDLSAAEARAILIDTAQTSAWCRDQGVVKLTARKLSISCGSGRLFSFSFQKQPSLVAKNVYGNRCVQYIKDVGTPVCALYWSGDSAQTHAKSFVRAWHVMAREAPALIRAQEGEFELAAKSYRSAPTRPQLPEDAVRYKVQAEFLVKQNRFEEAVDLFDQALEIAPWWPAGHYNRGLILGELKDYPEGIASLQRYLRLEPEAANARAVQLRIYEWESLAPAGSQ